MSTNNYIKVSVSIDSPAKYPLPQGYLDAATAHGRLDPHAIAAAKRRAELPEHGEPCRVLTWVFTFDDRSVEDRERAQADAHEVATELANLALSPQLSAWRNSTGLCMRLVGVNSVQERRAA